MGPVARRLGRQAPLVPRRLECGQRKWMRILSMKKKKNKKKKLTRGLYPDGFRTVLVWTIRSCENRHVDSMLISLRGVMQV